MEDILASIRRILSDDEPKAEETHPAPATSATAILAPQPAEEDVLMLDSSMLVPRPHAPIEEPPIAEREEAPIPERYEPPIAALVGPEAAGAAASSVDHLVRTLHTEQSLRVTSLGPTIEDIVRQEIRPLLKAWLDTNLPPLVERLVRTEIERVVGRVQT